MIAPGVYYDLPEREYRADPAVCNSDLGELEISPEHFKNQPEDEETKAKKMGTLIHAGVLEPARLGSQMVVRPSQWNDWRTTEAKEWKAAAIKVGKVVVTSDEHDLLLGCAKSCWLNPWLKETLLKSKKEVSVFAVDPETGLNLKIRVDILPDFGNFFCDFKTTRRAFAGPDRWPWEFFQKRYYRQASFYQHVLKLAGIERETVISIPIEKEPPYAVKPWNVPAPLLDLGEATFKRLLKIYAACQELGEWPGYPSKDGPVEVIPIDKRMEFAIVRELERMKA